MSGVKKEVWTGEIVKDFSHREQGTFLSEIGDYSKYAENNVIHLNRVGGKPEVLVNNSTYPIVIQEITETDIALSLDRYDTKPTSVTLDELEALTYDKIKIVKGLHSEALAEQVLDKSIHALAPAKHGDATPVLKTTGEVNGSGLKSLEPKTIIALKKGFDVARIPAKGRILVLCPEHVSDLLSLDQKFANQYYNIQDGKLFGHYYGFKIYECVSNPYFIKSSLVKKSYGSVPSSDDVQASVAFYAPLIFKAKGKTTMQYSKAETDPLHKRNLVSFRMHHITLPKEQRGIGAVVSVS